ncbi:MAG: hypothetical protein EBR59_04950 [Methylococcaceae bacterium]|jgi:SMC interacting uncharacterized protein involved in chromosome segregation|nr:hypothetical protein [Methylococcaceae bacterium]
MKYLLMLSIVFALTGCAEKQEFEQVVLEKMKIEKDIKDYKIDPEEMTKCVTSKTAMKMDGIFPGDPRRMQAYKNYIKMITLTESSDPKKTLDELRTDFGSPKGLADAHANYAESIVECLSGLVTGEEEKIQAVIEQPATKP